MDWHVKESAKLVEMQTLACAPAASAEMTVIVVGAVEIPQTECVASIAGYAKKYRWVPTADQPTYLAIY